MLAVLLALISSGFRREVLRRGGATCPTAGISAPPWPCASAAQRYTKSLTVSHILYINPRCTTRMERSDRAQIYMHMHAKIRSVRGPFHMSEHRQSSISIPRAGGDGSRQYGEGLHVMYARMDCQADAVSNLNLAHAQTHSARGALGSACSE